MKRNLFLCLTAGLLAWTAPALVAQSTNAPSTLQNQTPTADRRANRKELLRILGLDAQDLKSMTPEDRRAKIKDATAQKLSELKQEKDAGTITDQGQKDLAFLQAHMGHHAKAAASANN
jgi:uncharacterized protein (DUF305 family)